MTILGEGAFRYEVVEDWPRLPSGWTLGDVAAVAVAPDDRVFAFTRGEHPMIVLDPDGSVLATWGHGLFRQPHGLDYGADGCLWCTDDGDHSVRRCTPDGRVLLTLGTPGRAAPFMSGEPFHRCTHTALSDAGELFVADGYGNASVHKFDLAGRHLASWGGCGAAPGEFYIPHNIAWDPEGRVIVADRENHRLQLFDRDGRFLEQWGGLHRPCALCRTARDGNLYVGEAGPALALTLGYPNLGPRISILDRAGTLLARLSWGEAAPGRFIAPHGIAVDSRSDIYVGEVAAAAWPVTFPGRPMPDRVPTLHKLRRLPAAA